MHHDSSVRPGQLWLCTFDGSRPISLDLILAIDDQICFTYETFTNGDVVRHKQRLSIIRKWISDGTYVLLEDCE